MKTRISVLVLLVVVLAAVATGCGSNNPYVGTWQIPGGGGTIGLYVNGKGYQGDSGPRGDKIEWRKEGNHIVMTMDGGRDPVQASINNDGNLSIQDGGQTIIMQRVR